MTKPINCGARSEGSFCYARCKNGYVSSNTDPDATKYTCEVPAAAGATDPEWFGALECVAVRCGVIIGTEACGEGCKGKGQLAETTPGECDDDEFGDSCQVKCDDEYQYY